MKYPVELDTAYPCRGRDADGVEVHFHDLLDVGARVGQPVAGDPMNAFPPFGTVVRHADATLWIEADPQADAAHHHKAIETLTQPDVCCCPADTFSADCPWARVFDDGPPLGHVRACPSTGNPCPCLPGSISEAHCHVAAGA